MKKVSTYIALLIPVIFLFFGAGFHRAKYANDPDYIYLANALAICMGNSVGHIDNPGTTVMQIGAATISVKHFLKNEGNKDIVDDVLLHPDAYVGAIRIVLIFLNALILFLAGFFALRKTGSVWLAFLLQQMVFLTANTVNHLWTKVSPEPLLFFITQVFIIAILFFYADDDKTRRRHSIVFALIMGAGLGTKATFLPLTLFPLFIFPEFRKKLIYVLGMVASFVLFTIPAISEYKAMYYWFRSLVTHTGIYGHGDKGLIDTGTYLPNVVNILEANPVFTTVLALAAITIAVGIIRRKENGLNAPDWNIRILEGLSVSMACGVLLVAKHYHANHYLIPVLSLTGITLFFTYNSGICENIRSKSSGFFFPAVVIILAVLLAWKIPLKMKEINKGYKITNEEMNSTDITLQREFSDHTVIHYYPSSLNKYSALNFGDVYTRRQLLPRLKRLYPETYFYNFGLDLMQYWNAEIFLNDIVKLHGEKILMVGGPRDEGLLPELEKRGFPLNKKYHGRIQAVYELDPIRYKQSVEANATVLKDIVFCGGEQVSGDGKLLIGSNGRSFGSARSRSEQLPRTGKYGFKLDKTHNFAVEYKTDSLIPGDIYEIKAWRKSGNSDGILVIGAEKPNLFYKAQNDYIRSDNTGWDLVRITFTAPENLRNETVKIYFWNKGKEDIWFDDLTIEHYTHAFSPKNFGRPVSRAPEVME